MSLVEFVEQGKKNAKEGKKSLKQRFKEELASEKYGLYYVFGSLGAIVFSIITLILVASKFRPALIFVYLGITLAFVVSILVLEIIKGKNNKGKAKEKKGKEKKASK